VSQQKLNNAQRTTIITYQNTTFFTAKIVTLSWCCPTNLKNDSTCEGLECNPVHLLVNNRLSGESKGVPITPFDSSCPYTWACYGPYTTLVFILAHCEPLLPVKTDTEGFRMNPLDASESIDTWM